MLPSSIYRLWAGSERNAISGLNTIQGGLPDPAFHPHYLSVYASTSRLPDTLQHSILGPWLAVTQTGFPPACHQTISSSLIDRALDFSASRGVSPCRSNGAQVTNGGSVHSVAEAVHLAGSLSVLRCRGWKREVQARTVPEMTVHGAGPADNARVGADGRPLFRQENGERSRQEDGERSRGTGRDRAVRAFRRDAALRAVPQRE